VPCKLEEMGSCADSQDRALSSYQAQLDYLFYILAKVLNNKQAAFHALYLYFLLQVYLRLVIVRLDIECSEPKKEQKYRD
jgi:hypothetical protein